MAGYWLGERTLDRYVLRAARARNGAEVSMLCKEVVRLLRTSEPDSSPQISSRQIAPDENDVWCSLQRLVAQQRAVKFISQAHGTILYRGIR